jgi:hypothetical protein
MDGLMMRVGSGMIEDKGIEDRRTEKVVFLVTFLGVSFLVYISVCCKYHLEFCFGHCSSS